MKKLFAIILISLMVLSSAAAFAATEDPITGSVKTVAKAIQGTVAAGCASAADTRGCARRSLLAVGWAV
jgi:hypothetical protein